MGSADGSNATGSRLWFNSLGDLSGTMGYGFTLKLSLDTFFQGLNSAMRSRHGKEDFAYQLSAISFGPGLVDRPEDAIRRDVACLNMLWIGYQTARDADDRLYAKPDAPRPASAFLLPHLLRKTGEALETWHDYALGNEEGRKALGAAFLDQVAPLLKAVSDYSGPIHNDYGEEAAQLATNATVYVPRRYMTTHLEVVARGKPEAARPAAG
jgi:hypothetical protein